MVDLERIPFTSSRSNVPKTAFAARHYVIPIASVAEGQRPAIEYDSLLPFYLKANRLCEAGEFNYRATEAFKTPLAAMIRGFASPNFDVDALERFSCPTNFGMRYRHKLANSHRLKVLLHANVTDIKLGEAGDRVGQIVARTLRGIILASLIRHTVTRYCRCCTWRNF
jgi:hypothetical protein